MLRRIAAGSIALLALAGCGSTVALTSSQTSGGTSGTSGTSGGGALGVPSGDASTPSTGSSPNNSINPARSLPQGGTAPSYSDNGPASGTTASTSPNSSTTSTTPAESQPSTKTSTRPSTTSTGTGDQPIIIGLAAASASASNAVLGGIGSGLSENDARGEITAYANFINKHGGIDGHPIKMVFSNVNTGGTFAEAEEAACQTYTHDNHIDVSLDSSPAGELYTCLDKAGIAVVNDGVDALTTSQYAEWPNVYEPASISLQRLDALEVQQLPKMGFDPKGSGGRLGVLYFNTASFTQGFDALVADWRSVGVTVAASAAVQEFQSVSGIAGMEAQVQSAELKFRAEGVTRVMCVETNAWLCGFFGVYAASQGYYPKFAWTSDEPLTNVVANVPPKELAGSVFLGWYPGQDMDSTARMPARTRACINQNNTLGYASSSGNERSEAIDICESFGVLKQAVAAGGGITPSDIIAGMKQLNSRYQSFATFAVGGEQDGAAAVRRGKYEAKCSCFAYTSGDIAVPS